MTFPDRPSRVGFGPTMQDEKRIADPRFQVGADVLNLAFWQAAGMSKTSPLVVFNYLSGNTDFFMAAWEDAQYAFKDANQDPVAVDTLLANPWVSTVTVNGDNRVEIQFVDNVTTLAGTTVALNFAHATAFPITSSLDARCSCVVGAGGGGNLNLLTLGAHTGAAFDATVPMIVKVW